VKRFLHAAKLILTLKCEESSRIVSESMDRELTAVERWAVRMHVIGCWSCRRFGQQIRQLREAMKRHPDRTASEARLSPEAMKRIEEAIRNES